jgi:hypothetical protein
MSRSPISLLAVRYRGKAAWARKRASFAAGDLTRETLLQTAATYDRMALVAEELESKRLPSSSVDTTYRFTGTSSASRPRNERPTT